MSYSAVNHSLSVFQSVQAKRFFFLPLFQTRQNVVDVNYHITQYHYIIKELHLKIKHLQSRLDRQQSQSTTTTVAVGGGEGLVGSTSAITLSGREGEMAVEAGGYYYHGGHGETARITELCALLKTTSQEEKEIR